MATLSATTSFGRVMQMALTAGVVTAIVNAILFLIGQSMGAFPETVLTPSGDPITLGPVVISSLVPALISGLIYYALVRFTDRPARIFQVLAAVVFVMMIFTPVTLKNAPTSMIVILELMHVVAAGAIVWFLTGRQGFRE